MNKIILVTGATSGFGKAIAEKFAEAGWNCIITGRREERLKEFAEKLQQENKINVLPLAFDVRERETVSNKLSNLPPEWHAIDVLVNNAGLALGRSPFDEGDIDDWETMIDTNVKGLLYVSKAIIPYFKKGGKGHIINMGSVAGKEIYKDGNVYCASKFAVDAITKSQRVDLLPHKIKVTGIHPGAALTEFGVVRFKGDEQKANSVYDGYQPLSASDVADVVYYAATMPANVCLNDIVITATAQANAIYFQKE
ncbi:MAG: oxidoreductase, short chain dehydrogenase/reductase family [Chitinophagaceae bacterium]|nr:oxidoreductase, short chain dehydrogenase/reductase family [Chitinophagaceae bacterium]